MKFAYKFSNLLGTVYRKGDLLFTPDGNSVISPVGNRITIYDLKNNKSSTLPVESRFNYTTLDLSPNGCTLLAVNEEGEAHMISMVSRRVIHKYRFRRPVACIRFSPDGKHFAACKDSNVFVFKAPGPYTGQFNPFVMERVFHGSFDETTCLDWSSDSRILAVGSKDMSTRLYTLENLANFKTYSLGSHTDSIVACFFEKDSLDITTISRNGQVCVWECSIDMDLLKPWEPPPKKTRQDTHSDSEDDVDTSKAEENPAVTEVTADTTNDDRLFYKRLARHYLCDLMRKEQRNVKLTCAAYHKMTHILITGFSNGSFFLHELPEVNHIHSLSISDQKISSIALNSTGDWVALGCVGLGQLLVWEWQSETYVMKQQGHFNNMACLAYSPDGQYIVTGGEDGKVKLWNTSTGFCFVTFHEHTANISAVQFSHNRKFIISASQDGTVRAYDMTRYRNFRTFTSPRPVQFACVALDSTGEFVAAGGQDVFEIYLWSMKIGRLLEILSGHEGPVVSVAFNPSPASTALASVSWDKTLKLWNAVESGSTHETIQLTADGLYVTYKPNGEEVAVATLDGQITFFHCKTSVQIGSIEGRNDLGSGRSDTDLVTAKKSLQGKAFTSLCYSADGSCILAGGQSKNVCIYNVREGMLLKKFEITQNRSFDAVDDFINRRKMTEFGNMALVEEREEREGGDVVIKLPGVRSGDMAARVFKPEVRVYCLQFSPTGQSWAAATTEGLLIYSLETGMVFDPFQLEMSITPDAVKKTLKDCDYAKALMMAIKLNEQNLIQEVIESTKPSDVELTVRSLPEAYMERTLKFVASSLESTCHIQFYLMWVQHILTVHGPVLQAHSKKAQVMPIFLTLQKNLTKKYEDLAKICDFNKYTMQFLVRLGQSKAAIKQEDEEEEEMEVAMEGNKEEDDSDNDDIVSDEEEEEEGEEDEMMEVNSVKDMDSDSGD
ncbi:periodic tryptophan protein 2 homolog [Periplaneta americana]|uniref:periodic tryptophan protein 2 homolog n=1 Tax=Periplaneta americana TaxID=6978 RepID=UPI0037E8A06C